MFGKTLVLVDVHLLKEYRRYRKAHMNRFGVKLWGTDYPKSFSDCVESALIRDIEKMSYDLDCLGIRVD